MIAFIFALCLGMNQYWINDTQQMLSLLNPPCWYDWGMREEFFNHQEYSPMLWKVNNRNLLNAGELAIKYPGKTWFVYNEPEGKDQANTTPEIAAEWFDKAYSLIKTNDPTAKVGCCGVMIRDIGIEWLNEFRPKNQPDFYHIHIYATNKKDWQSLVDYWHSWNLNNIPTYITETCGMYSNDQTELINYVANYSHPNIKQIYWFAAYPQGNWKCGMVEDGKLNNLGNIYKQNLPLKITPTIEPPTPTPTLIATIAATSTPFPVITLQPVPTNTPTPSQDDTTLIPEGDEPVILVYQNFQPIAFK